MAGAGALAVTTAIIAVSSIGAGSAAAAAGPQQTPGKCPTGKTGISSLPKAEQSWYSNVDSTVQACVSPYATWMKPLGKPPWTIAYVGTYDGNTWRQLSLKRIEALAKQYEKAGLVKKLIVTNANENSTLMIQQINQVVSEGAQAILTTSPPASAIDGTLKTLYKKHIPFVSIDGDTDSPYYLATGGNLRAAGVLSAQWLVKKMGTSGTILAINGIPGITASEATWSGAQSVFKEYPGINLLGGQPIYGDYTESIAKSAALKTLAANPQPIKGVFVQGSMEMAAIQALQQTGRPSVPVTFGGATNAGVYWEQHPSAWDQGFIYYPTIPDTSVAWNVMMRTLEGQGPKITSMTHPPVTITYKQVKPLIPSGAGLGSTEWLSPPSGEWWTTAQINGFFNKPANPLNYKG
jgi:ribose transport system substrate-binding protein